MGRAWHSEKGPGGLVLRSRREWPGYAAAHEGVLHSTAGVVSWQVAWPLLPLLQPRLLLQASSTCPKCHIYLCWFLRHQAHPPPPWTVSPTSPQHPNTSAADLAAPHFPQVTPLPLSWVRTPASTEGGWVSSLHPQRQVQALPEHWAESQDFWLAGGPTHLTKPSATSSSERERERDRDREREREREKSILTSTTTVEHAPIWRPGRASEVPAPAFGGPRGPCEACLPDATACPHQVQSRAAAAVAAGVGAAAVVAAAPPPTPTPTSTRPSHPGPRTPSSRDPACYTTRA